MFATRLQVAAGVITNPLKQTKRVGRIHTRIVLLQFHNVRLPCGVSLFLAVNRCQPARHKIQAGAGHSTIAHFINALMHRFNDENRPDFMKDW